MKVISKTILSKQITANDYADEFKMAVGDALEEFADKHMKIRSITELADLVGVTEKKMLNILSGVTELKVSELARYAYMMGCRLRIVLESQDGPTTRAKKGGAD